jgi:protein-disulfide isomerase
MGKRAVSVEFFFAGGCSNCVKAREALRETAQSTAEVEWTEIDIAKNPGRAVDLGVLTTPAVAINGKLQFKSVPTAADLQHAIKAQIGKA